jgi:hypothetical protein
VCVCGSDDGGDDSVVATGVLELDTSDAVAIPERESTETVANEDILIIERRVIADWENGFDFIINDETSYGKCTQ